MKTKSLLASVTVLLLSMPLAAAPGEPSVEPPAPAAPGGGIELGVTYATNYVWRGADIYANYWTQNNKMQGSFQTPGAIQPSITFSTPVEGLSFNIWGSFAQRGRSDVDTDGRIQRSPGGANIITTGVIANDVQSSLATTPLPTTIAGQDTATCSTQTTPNCTPNLYKEQVGLKRVDEVDFTLAYERETKLGTMGMGLINYVNPGTQGKSAFGAITEVYVSYALPFFSDLKFTAYSGIDGVQEQYYNSAYSKNIDLSKTLTLDLALSAGYKVKEGLQGWNDVTGAIGLTFSGISVAFNVAHRPDLRFFDTDTNTNLPLWAEGGSTSGDGLVADPSKNQGLINEFVNGQLTNVLYGQHGSTTTYTARSKLPRNLYWVTVGYTKEL